MNQTIIDLVAWVLFTLAAIIWHEWGHIEMLKEMHPLWKNPYKWWQLRTGWNDDDFTKKENAKIYVVGIVGGFIPVIVGIFFLPGLLGLALVAVYFTGCLYDLKQLRKYW